MKSGSGSSSPNEDVSRYQPFTQLCLRRLNEFGDALTMPALSRTVLNTSDQNYQAMLSTRHRQHRRRPCRLIHSLRLPDEQRHRRGTTLTCAAPVGGHGTEGPRVPQVLERPVLQVQLLVASVRDGCAPRGCTDAHTGGTSRAGEGVESRDGLGGKRTEEARVCSGTEWYYVGKRVGRESVEFSDEICYRRFREIVTYGESGTNS
jgi:hypothetical protein